MFGDEVHDVERKSLAILRILSESPEPMGARVVARRLKDHGIDLTERAVRYHLKLMDERGLTRLVGRDGRLVTEDGVEELKNALVQDKVGLAISRIEVLAFHTDFDPATRSGRLPVNVSLYPKERFARALSLMAPAFRAGLSAGDRVGVAWEGERIGDVFVPEGKVALATVCSVVVNGVLLKAGVPMDSRFGGILQVRHGRPVRFVELIHYAGSSLDPSEIFIRGKMTGVAQAVRQGSGRILANFREIPSICRDVAEEVVSGLAASSLSALLLMGQTSAPVCEVPVHPGKLGMILIGGLNPVAAAAEGGIQAENHAMAMLMDYRELIPFEELAKTNKITSERRVHR